MSQLGTDNGKSSEIGVTLLIDRSDESRMACSLLLENGVPFILVSADPVDSDTGAAALPAVYVPPGSRFNGSRTTFRGLREIRTLFLPRFHEKATEGSQH